MIWLSSVLAPSLRHETVVRPVCPGRLISHSLSDILCRNPYSSSIVNQPPWNLRGISQAFEPGIYTNISRIFCSQNVFFLFVIKVRRNCKIGEITNIFYSMLTSLVPHDFFKLFSKTLTTHFRFLLYRVFHNILLKRSLESVARFSL